MRVLIGSCGGLVGSYLARQFKALGCTVCGADGNIPNPTSLFLDEEYGIVSASDTLFLSQLIEILIKKKIDCYIPTNSKEIIVVSKLEKEIRNSWNGFFVVCPFDTFQKLNNKVSANINLNSIGIPVPKLISSLLEDDLYPIFMKPLTGSGSKNSCLIQNKKSHELEMKNENNCFFEYIKGKEFTVDCFYDCMGKLVSFNQRLRKKDMGGAVIITQNDYSFDIFPYLEKISSAFIFKGCVNFQYILKDGIPYFIDVNLRYASGGLPLSVKSGLNVPKFIIELSKGVQLTSFVPSKKNDGLTMYRYFEEWYK